MQLVRSNPFSPSVVFKPFMASIFPLPRIFEYTSHLRNHPFIRLWTLLVKVPDFSTMKDLLWSMNYPRKWWINDVYSDNGTIVV